jgi:hypothetical protein
MSKGQKALLRNGAMFLCWGVAIMLGESLFASGIGLGWALHALADAVCPYSA